MTSKTTHSRPSHLLCVADPLAAYQFDAAVTTFGVTLENALQETRESGTGSNKRLVPRYKLTDLLADGFQFPREDTLAGLRGMDGYEEVR